ncbi:sigma-70 RNA polymerase sigma factor region 4 domain-containing protein, partial [Streptomyces chiangmaiensis]
MSRRRSHRDPTLRTARIEGTFEEMLSLLGQEGRTIFIERFVMRRTYREIGELLDLTPDAVARRARRIHFWLQIVSSSADLEELAGDD